MQQWQWAEEPERVVQPGPMHIQAAPKVRGATKNRIQSYRIATNEAPFDGEYGSKFPVRASTAA
jgi:hypothetical protein